MEIIVDHVYRAKKPAAVGATLFQSGFYNDRQVKYVSDTVVHYDSPAVSFGRHYPKVKREMFEKWASSDITDIVPENDWIPFE